MITQTVPLLLEGIRNHQVLVWWVGVLSVLMSLGFLVAIPIIIVRLPADYFLERANAHEESDQTLGRVIYILLKNMIAVFLVVAGVAMLFLPGQGLITWIIGLSLLSIPGKQRLMLKIVRQENVWYSLNRIRAKFHKQPFTIRP